MEDVPAFLECWQIVMEGEILPDLSQCERATDRFWPISPADIKGAMLSLNSAPEPDGCSSKDLRKVPVAILRVLLNVLSLQKRPPVCLQSARTVFLPKIDGASDPKDFTPITVSSILL